MLTHVVDGKVVRVKGDPDHPITKGFLCGRYQHFEDIINHPDRLLFPLMRESKSDPFRRVTWDEALGTIARRYTEIIETAEIARRTHHEFRFAHLDIPIIACVSRTYFG